MPSERAICRNCGAEYDRRRPWQEYCGLPCRLAWHQKRQLPTTDRTVDLAPGETVLIRAKGAP